MPVSPSPTNSLKTDRLAALRSQLASAHEPKGPVLPFGVPEIDGRLANGGLDAAGLHEVAAACSSLNDDAAATLFLGGIAARFAAQSGRSVLWTLTNFDLYAPGLEQVGLGADTVFYAQGRHDSEVLSLCEDGLRDSSLACVVAEVKAADQTVTRRLQLAAADGRTPLLLYRRHRVLNRPPFSSPSAAITRWMISCRPSTRLETPGVGRARWFVELVRQRNGNPFNLEVEACDDTGSLALPAAARHRAASQAGASHQAA